ncbi:N-acetylmuramic acid 6-phosphate etherase [Rhodomicrobium lacus]|uniref:N-acetylmuramic acid 6-phosphate etherase n=1 Tax=Rhodomicrobium lacus TaxID=2498452 RepID=UPI000F8CE5B8|nr:N-acetylmuramic acid 6-phosphate etherase [Rhodomicrobium lacus]WKW49910.1 N-acetylmuramic acid 6-phosphate etherase [Rhodomicrobium lacus]
MDTERPSPRFSGIDVWEPLDALDAMIEGQLAAVAAVRAARRDILHAVLAMEKRLASGGRLVYAGAGTSGRLAVQDGAELMPTFSWPKDRLVLLLAGGDEAMVQAVEGAEDETHRAAELIRVEHGICANDVLVAVAASGKTPFTLSALREAKKLGALAVGIANNPGTPLLAEADCPICLETGSEPIAGSTRMNAGTAQRVTLAMLSSLVMIRLGRVYEGLMVEVQAVNAKLVGRREKMLVHLTGKDLGAVRGALSQTGGNIKLAVLVLQGCALDEARALLERSGGRLRDALAVAAQGKGAD